MSRSLWLFGYGSLIWRPGFDYEERVPGFVKGWARRFWQGSTDHRGTPEAPGRVVTLVEAPGASCWGVAYRLRPSTAATVLERLDHREQGGYERHQVVVTPKSPAAGSSIHALVYIAGRNNPDYLGPAPLSEMAAQIRASHGPSGANLEYVLELARALAALGIVDPHVQALVEELTPAVGSMA